MPTDLRPRAEGMDGCCLDPGPRTYEDRDLGVMNDVVTDAAKERATNSVQTYHTTEYNNRPIRLTKHHNAQQNEMTAKCDR